jgi:hypothetical protein
MKNNTVFWKLELCPSSAGEKGRPLATHLQQQTHHLKDSFKNVNWPSKLMNKDNGWVGMKPGIC